MIYSRICKSRINWWLNKYSVFFLSARQMNKRRISFPVAVARKKCSGYKSTRAPRGNKRRALCLPAVPPRHARRSVNSRGLCGSMPDRTAFRTLCYKITARAAHISRPSPLLLCPRRVNHFSFAQTRYKSIPRV